MTYPDLAQIVPLAKLLHVTTDELLDADIGSDDERKAYFEKEYHQYWMKDDHEADYKIAKQAVLEYPGEFKYLEWLAGTEWYVGYSPEYLGTDTFYELIDSSIKHYQMILDDCNDAEIRNRAISGIVYDYTAIGKYDEARKYAEMYPQTPEVTRDEILAVCLQGDELTALRRKIIRNKLNELCTALNNFQNVSDINEAIDAEEKIIRAVISDENYLTFHCQLYFIYMKRAELAVGNNDYDGAVSALIEAKKHAQRYDDLYTEGQSSYTCPILENLTEDVQNDRDIGKFLDLFKNTLTDENKFRPLFVMENFRMLTE